MPGIPCLKLRLAPFRECHSLRFVQTPLSSVIRGDWTPFAYLPKSSGNLSKRATPIRVVTHGFTESQSPLLLSAGSPRPPARATIPAVSQRVVSLLPSCTEIVCELGAAGCLVGRSHECDFPAAVQVLPVCTAARLDSVKPGAEIHRDVTTLLEQSLSLYTVDVAQLRALKPDLILTQAQCEVCAVNVDDVERALGEWTGARPRVLSLSPRRMVDIWDDMRRVAESLGLEDCGRTAIKPLKTRCVDVIEKVAGMTRRQSVACIEWLDPLMAAGNWVPELVELAGGRNLFGEAGKHSPWMKWEELVAADPDVIVVMPCGFDLSRALRELPALAGRPEWETLSAVKNHRVYVTDGNAFFNRPGPRIVDSLEILAEVLHPVLFEPRHQGGGWERI
jgi:iron complex transport system substrate-binding protein